jgi:hypothetical protein
MGRANWWAAPAPLRRLHDRFGLREGPSQPRPPPLPQRAAGWRRQPDRELADGEYGRGMRFVWAAAAVAPFVTVAVGMLTGHVRARSCCAVPTDQDARLHAAGYHEEAAVAAEPAQRELYG